MNAGTGLDANPRLVAWKALRAHDAPPLRAVEGLCAERGLDARDAALARRLVGCEARRRGTLRAILAHLAPRKPDASLATHLHLGLVQLFFLDRIADHAAVGETVEIVKRTHGEPQARFANAVLRRALALRVPGPTGEARRDLVGRPLALAEALFRDPAEHPLLWAEDALSMPAPLLKRWKSRVGLERALDLARAALEEAPLSLRVVAREPDAPVDSAGARARVREALAAGGIPSEPGEHPAILIAAAEHAAALIASAPFREGHVTIQGQTALEAAELVQARAGERVLDLCAAPGGKTAVLARDGAELVACDVDEAKLERTLQTLVRLGVSERVRLVRLGSLAGAHELPEAVAAGGFDAVLVDAPCTNTGVLAARPEARWRFSRATQAELVALQSALLERAARHVRPGGRLVWSTCSLEPEEGPQLVRAFLERRREFALHAEIERWPASSPSGPDAGGRFSGPLDGGYAARLVRGA